MYENTAINIFRIGSEYEHMKEYNDKVINRVDENGNIRN